MPKIEVLSEVVSSQIAAGEVIERPASIIKELAENSLDAGSSSISIDIGGGGIDYLRISDNGCGIPFDEAALAFVRHATSKIRSAMDLEAISTLGFRGEALASIAAVSKVVMKTRERGSEYGTLVEIHGGRLIKHEECGCPDGTSIEVQQLFYNVPARLKFLKSSRAESGYIGDYVSRLIMCRPDVSFKLKSQDKLIYQSAGDGNLQNAIYTVYGKEILRSLKPVSYDDGYIRITGYIGIESIAQMTRSKQSFFLNGRYIKSAKLSYSLQQAFDTRIMKGRFPFAVINIELSSAEVDVNVHPNKLDVRFKNEERVTASVCKAVIAGLYNERVLIENKDESTADSNQSVLSLKPSNINSSMRKPAAAIPPPQMLSDSARAIPTSATIPNSAARSTYASTHSNFRTNNLTTEEKMRIGNSTALNTTEAGYKTQSEDTKRSNEEQAKPNDTALPIIAVQRSEIKADIIASNEKLTMDIKQPFRIIGCAFETYWIVEQGNNLFYIDHHAAHERKLYDEYINKTIENRSQILLVPIQITLDSNEHATLLAHMNVFSELGFDIDELGALSMSVRAVPYFFDAPTTIQFLHDAIALIGSSMKSLQKSLFQSRLIQMACKHAIKGGQHIDEIEIRKLLEYFSHEGAPLTCPHGRPVLVQIKRNEIEKMFGRIV